jgi:hypothetical protein
MEERPAHSTPTLQQMPFQQQQDVACQLRVALAYNYS